MLPLPKEKQMELLANPDSIKAEVDANLAGDWNRRAELFDLTQDEFRQWADEQNLEAHGVCLTRGQHDGLYLVQTLRGDWEFFWQERESPINPVLRFEDFQTARRYLLADRLKPTLGFDPLGSVTPVKRVVTPYFSLFDLIGALFFGLGGLFMLFKFTQSGSWRDLLSGLGGIALSVLITYLIVKQFQHARANNSRKPAR